MELKVDMHLFCIDGGGGDQRNPSLTQILPFYKDLKGKIILSLKIFLFQKWRVQLADIWLFS